MPKKYSQKDIEALCCCSVICIIVITTFFIIIIAVKYWYISIPVIVISLFIYAKYIYPHQKQDKKLGEKYWKEKVYSPKHGRKITRREKLLYEQQAVKFKKEMQRLKRKELEDKLKEKELEDKIKEKEKNRICDYCGNITDEPFDICPLCGAKNK